MSETSDKFEEQKERAKKYLLQMLKEKFEGLVLTCEDRFGASDNGAICLYHGQKIVDCRFSTCPRINLPHNVASSYPKKKRR